MKRLLPALLLLATTAIAFLACATPGKEISPQPGDFAFLEIQLRG
jgi:hypothetical protein